MSLSTSTGSESEYLSEPAPHTGVRLRDFKIRWHVLIPLVVLHAGALAAFWFVDFYAIGVAVALWVITGMLGITVGYHRLLAHQALEMPRWLKRFHLFCGVLAFQLGPITWVRMHRAHHAYSDRLQDPHPQLFGFWYGHMGWTFLAHKEIGRGPRWKETPQDLLQDPFVSWLERNVLWFFLGSLVLLYALGGLPLLLWAGFFRWAWVSHITWCVNSVGHRFGYRNFETNDQSTNHWLVALLAFGEGWHNNHHRFPSSAKQGLKFWEFDLSWQWIRLLKFFGLAWDVKTPAIYAPPPQA